MIFQLMGLTALLLFYGVYFGKMAAQRKQGIQTDHIAKGGKKGRLFRVEMTMKADLCSPCCGNHKPALRNQPDAGFDQIFWGVGSICRSGVFCCLCLYDAGQLAGRDTGR